MSVSTASIGKPPTTSARRSAAVPSPSPSTSALVALAGEAGSIPANHGSGSLLPGSRGVVSVHGSDARGALAIKAIVRSAVIGCTAGHGLSRPSPSADRVSSELLRPRTMTSPDTAPMLLSLADPAARGCVLLVDDDEELLELLAEGLGGTYDVLTAPNPREARAQLAEHEVAVVVSDQHMPGETGIEFLKSIRHQHLDCQRILLTGYSERRLVLSAVNDGAVDAYLVKDGSLAELERHVRKAHAEWERRQRAEGARDEAQALRVALRSEGALTRRVERLVGRSTHAVIVLIAAVVLFTAFGAVGLAILYVLKVALGVDLFSDFHLT